MESEKLSELTFDKLKLKEKKTQQNVVFLIIVLVICVGGLIVLKINYITLIVFCVIWLGGLWPFVSKFRIVKKEIKKRENL